jgi:hypothetical protein
MIHASVGMMRALNRHVERVFDPSRKKPALGKAQIEERRMIKASVQATRHVGDYAGAIAVQLDEIR